MSEIEQERESQVVQEQAEPVPVEPTSQEMQPTHPTPRAMTWLGAALTFAGREIVPRLAALLLDVWDRHASRPASSSSDAALGPPGPSSRRDMSEGRGRQHRRRRRGD